MVRKNLVLTLLSILVFLAACRKDQFLTDIPGSSPASTTYHSESPSGTTFSNYHGLYIDSTSSVLGDTTRENNLLRWCKQHHITTLSFYDLRQVMTLKKSANLAAFLKRAKTDYGIVENTAVIGSDAFIATYLDTFNRSNSDTLQRFNTVNLEKEWWNGDGNFKTYISILSKLKQWAKAQIPMVKTEEYIGWFQNPYGKELYMANELVKNSDRILVHDYQRYPSFGYVQSRLDYLGQAAKAQGKIFPVIIIFSAEPEFSADYFRTHSFEEAYQIIEDGYFSSSFPGKNYIKLIGYQIFDQSFARNVKPMILL